MHILVKRMRLIFFVLGLGCLFAPMASLGVAFLDNQTQYQNQDPNIETRRSDHFRECFGHYNRDSGMGGMTEAMAQGNLQMFEQEWNHIVVELGMHDWNESTNPTYIDGNKYRTNFNFLMTFNDGGGGGAYMSSDSHGFAYCMANPASCRWDPPSGATPHEMGHVWEGSCNGFNGTDSSGSWWECTANWVMLQFINTYPQAGGYLYNSVFYPAHGRDMYDSWMIWEAAKDDPRYGTAWVNSIWTNADATQRVSEYILDRMIRLDTSGSADKAGGMKDLWGDMAKKMVTWDYERQRWLAQANTPWNGDTWEWYTRCRCPLVKMPGNSGTYRPAREHIPVEFGFHFIPLTVSPSTTVSCNFQPLCDPVRQSDWRACLVAVSNNGDAKYSCLWNKGTNSITLSSDESQLYLMVIAVPKPMKIVTTTVNGASGNAWSQYTTDSGLQFPYTVSFTNATPTNVTYPTQAHTNMHQHSNGSGWVSNNATVDATAYVGPNAQVLDNAKVLGNARIEEYGVVKNNAQVRDNAIVSGHGVVSENAQVYGNAKVRDWAIVYGYSEVYENAKAIEHAGCGGGDATNHNVVNGSVVMKGVTSVYSPSIFSGSLITDGDTANGNGNTSSGTYIVANKGVHFGWQWGQNPYVFGVLADNKYQYCGLTFERQNAVFACDEFGINHGYLMNGCRNTIDSGTSVRGGYVLALNGVDQYVELHNSLNDFKDMSVAVWVKWAGTGNDQRIWSMGDGANKQMYLTPRSLSSGKVRFTITDGTTTQYIDGTAALGTGWSHVAVTFSGNTGTLYVNGAQVGQNTLMTLDPDALNAPLMENANYLGRGNSGNYFQGSIDDFRVYNKTLSSSEVSTLYSTAPPATVTPTADMTAPTPNAATWLVAPNAISDSAITMSATQGTDASGWVEYYFACTSGGGHDSGWVSFNKYTDVGLTPGTAYTYTVKMRDKNGNTTADSVAQSATTQTSSVGAASFAYGPVGIDASSIKMVATKQSAPSGQVEYNFIKMLPTGTVVSSSGWRASPTWIDTGLAANSSFKYAVQVRDGRGNVSAQSASVSATAKDMAAPVLPIAVANWLMMPYATIDNCISMTAQSVQEANVSVYYQCVSGGGPDSGWLACNSTDDGGKTYYARWTTPTPLADGTYAYRYKLKDAAGNESGYSTTYSGTITPTTGYHACTFAQLTTLADDCLVKFDGVVTAINSDNYVVRDPAGTSTIKVKPDTYAQVTDPSFVFKNVSIKGHLYTISGVRYVTYASLNATGSSAYSISGKVTDASGNPIAGATVYFSSTANASSSPAATATTDSMGTYTMSIINGAWYVCAGSGDYYTSADQSVTINGASVKDINFSLNAKPKIVGTVTDQSTGSPVAGAMVYLKSSSGALTNPTYSLTADANGNYSQIVTPGTWYAVSGKSGYDNTVEQSVVAADGVQKVMNFSLIPPAPKNIPKQDNLLFAALAEALPPTGNIPSWDTYSPTGTMTITGVPTVDPIGVKKWEKNTYLNSSNAKGFIQGTYSAAIPVNGATIVMLVRPARNSTNTTTTSCVDIFNNELSLGVRNSTGMVNAYVNGTQTTATTNAIATNTPAVVSLVVQPNGSFVGYSNGTQVLSGTSAAGMTSLDITSGTNIRVGRGQGSTTSFSGDMGDVFVYKVALTDTERQQLEADILARLNNNGTKYTITANAGVGGSITPASPISVYAGANQTVSIVPNVGYGVSDVLVDGVSVGAVSSYTFTNVTANHTVSASFYALTAYTITATAGTGGTLTPSGVLTVYETSSKTFTIKPNTGYTIASVTVDGLNKGALSSYTFTNINANHTIAVAFTNLNRNIPQTDSLLFGAVTDSFMPSSGLIGNWATIWPVGSTLNPMGTPTMTTIGGKKWEQNNYTENDGFVFGTENTTAIPINGASIVVAVKPNRNTSATSWTSCVDIFYDELVLGIKNSTGEVVVRRNGSLETSSTTIPSGQVTVLSCVMAPDGTYKVWANGTQIMTNTIATPMPTLDPDHTSTWGNNPTFAHYINVGRNNPDGWTTFNGNIGDVFVYKVALTDADRQTLETDLMNKFTGVTITASAGAGGTISPSGTVTLASGASQTFTITPSVGYQVSSVVVDGVSQGAINSYTFNNVTTSHTISATFTQAKYTITATAGAGGTISPSGDQLVTYGTSKSFTITASSGYVIADVKVDGASIGAVSSYTFVAVSAGHTISATFNPVLKITASAGTGGTISPSGSVSVNSGANQTFTIAPSAGYCIADVTVDGASVGAVSSYTFSNITANHTISVVFAEDVANIAALKNKAADSVVRLTGSETVIYAPKDAASTRTTKFFYIGESQGRGGLKITDKTGDALTIGNKVTNLVGYVRKSSGKETYLELISDVTGSGNTPIKPVGANNRGVLLDAKIQTNAVVVWGKVMSVDGTTSFEIGDGYASNLKVILNGIGLPSGFGTTRTAIVSGIVTRDDAGTAVIYAQKVDLP